ncbi:MAG: DUF2470 domain-containing protein [Mycetocola sp.]
MADSSLSPDIVDAALHHMNTDHVADNLVIVHAFADPLAESAILTGVDGDGGTWAVAGPAGNTEVKIPWSTPVETRAGIRREVVVLYDTACERLGLPRRAH